MSHHIEDSQWFEPLSQCACAPLLRSRDSDYWGHVLLGVTDKLKRPTFPIKCFFFRLLVKIEISGDVSSNTHVLELALVSLMLPSHVCLTFSRCGSSKFCKFHLLPKQLVQLPLFLFLFFPMLVSIVF